MDKKKEAVATKATQANKEKTPAKFLVGTVVNGRAMLLGDGASLVIRGARNG